MQTLYDDAGLYDLVAPPDAAMAGHYARAVGGPGRDVLELGCGTGRLTGPVAETGAQVVGLDLSDTMLAVARERVPSATFHAADMRSFDLGRPFDAAFIGANSLLHLRTAADFAGFFSSVARHLKPEGTLWFDIFVPSLALLTAPPGQRQPLGEFHHAALGPVRIDEILRYDPLAQVLHATWYWSSAERPDFRVTQLAMRQIFPAELPSLLAANGFRLVERWGDFDASPFSAQSRRQVCATEPR
jgi:SAM-dependent methyltransferase